VECKLRYVNFRSVSDPRGALQLAFRVTEISDDRYKSTMGVIVISLGIPWSARENFGYTREHLRAPATTQGAQMPSPRAPVTSLGVPATSLGALTKSLTALATILGAPQITVEQSRKNIFFENAAGAPGNHSYHLTFNDC
jgi:hypothetical protein